MVADRRVKQRLLASLTVEDCNGHTPEPLPRDAPVGPCRNHVGDAVFTPFGQPTHLVDFIQRLLPQPVVVDRDEPLTAGTENYGVVAAPAVGIRMVEPPRRPEQGTTGLQELDNRFVGLEDHLAGIFREPFDELA